MNNFILKNPYNPVKYYTKIINLIAASLLFQMFLYIITPQIINIVSEIILTITSGERSLMYQILLQITKILMYIIAFMLPTYIYIKIRQKKWCDYISFSPVLPKKPIFSIFIALAIILSTGYVSNLFFACFENFGIKFVSTYSNFPTTPINIILLFISSVIVPTIVEEFLFRGVILHELLPFGKNVAIIMSGLLFGIMHFNPTQLFYATCVGIVMAYLVLKSKSIWISIFIHMVNNTISFYFYFLQTYASDKMYNQISLIISCIIFIIAIIGLISINKANNKPDYNIAVEEYGLSQRILIGKFFTPIMLVYIGFAIVIMIGWLVV